VSFALWAGDDASSSGGFNEGENHFVFGLHLVLEGGAALSQFAAHGSRPTGH